MNIIAVMKDNDDATDQVYNCALNAIANLNKLYEMIEDRLINKIQNLSKNKTK